jgi:hypothetical protein
VSIDSPELILFAGSVISIAESSIEDSAIESSPLPNDFISPLQTDEVQGKF